MEYGKRIKKEATTMANRNKTVSKGAANALDQLKYEVAAELGIPLDQMDNGDLTTRQVGQIGGGMTRRLVKFAEDTLKAQGPETIMKANEGNKGNQ